MNLRRLGPFFILLLSCLLFYYFKLNRYVSLEYLQAQHPFIRQWTLMHYLSAPILFMLCYTLAVALSIPGALFFTLLAGFLFGIFWGTVFVVLSASLGASIVFLAVRLAFNDWAAQRTSDWVRQMRQGFQDNALSYLLAMRLFVLFPFWVVNIVPALLGVDIKIFIVGTFFGIIPGSLVYVSLGNGLHTLFEQEQVLKLSHIVSPALFLPLIAFAFLALTPILYKRLSKKDNTSFASRRKTKDFISCDIAIIGAGAGGLSLAALASQLGLKVVLIEKSRMGGDCLHYGCVPSKTLLAWAKTYWQVNQSAKNPKLDAREVFHRIKTVIKTLAVHDSVARFESLGVQVLQKEGKFIDKTTLNVGSNTVKARHFVIATGSKPAIPAIPGLSEIEFYTNETIFDLETIPEQLIIVGGGAIGLELAQGFAMLGSKTSLLEATSILSQEDSEASAVIRQSLINTGIDVFEHINIKEVGLDSPGKLFIRALQGEKMLCLKGTHLLIAVGRVADFKDLNCELAGVETDSKGIITDRRLRTSNKNIYAIGDVTGHHQFTHVANYHAGILLRNIGFKLPTKLDTSSIPSVIYTAPELAQVGKNEAYCKAMKSPHRVLKLDYSSIDRAHTDDELTGFIKIIANPKGLILGATIVGKNAGELLLPWIMAIREGKTLRSFTDVIVPYPTLSELSKKVAGQFYLSKLFSKPVKKLVKFLSYF